MNQGTFYNIWHHEKSGDNLKLTLYLDDFIDPDANITVSYHKKYDLGFELTYEMKLIHTR